MKKIFKAISDLFKRLRIWWIETQKDDVMIVTYDTEDDYISCIDWCGQQIPPFCGKFTLELWEEIKKWCRVNDTFPYTRIYIWAGMEKKHLAYCEPIKNYIENIDLLKTGQGFHYGSGKKFEHDKCSHPINRREGYREGCYKCYECGRIVTDEINTNKKTYTQKELDDAIIQALKDQWIKFDWDKKETRPTEYGKYLIRRKDGKVHWETWNGSGWAYNHNEIRYWLKIPEL